MPIEEQDWNKKPDAASMAAAAKARSRVLTGLSFAALAAILALLLGIRIGSWGPVYEFMAEGDRLRAEQSRLEEVRLEEERCRQLIPRGAIDVCYPGDGRATFSLEADGKLRRMLCCYHGGSGARWVMSLDGVSSPTPITLPRQD